MDTRHRDAHTRSARLLALVPLALVALLGCDAVPPSTAPATTPSADRPAVRIDETWRADDGEWTFTGDVDPQGDPTDVVLEVGPGPESLRRFDAQLPVAQDLTEQEPVTITTRELPDVEVICVRFAATNSAGTTVSSPLCVPHDIPSIVPAAPTVQIDPDWTVADGEWTFRARVDPGSNATDVVLEIGPGPESAARFDTEVPAAEDLTDAVTLTVATSELPDSDEVCVRFTATNSLATTSSTALCFARDAPGSSPR